MAERQKKAIGQRIKELRTARRMTQQQLAAKIPSPEVDAQYVSKWERGIYTPHKHLEALARALDTSEGDILAGRNGKTDEETPDVLEALNPSEATAETLLGEIRSLRSELLAELAAVRSAQASLAARLSREERGRAKTGS